MTPTFDRVKARAIVTEECLLRTHGLTVEEVLNLLEGCWTGNPITLADLDASEYDSLVVGLITERDREHERVALIRALGEEAARDNWSAIAITSAIRSVLRTQASA